MSAIHAEARAFGQIYREISQRDSGLIVSNLTLIKDPFTDVPSDIRPNSGSVEDFGLGDAGKGHTAQEIVNLLVERVRNSQLLNQIQN